MTDKLYDLIIALLKEIADLEAQRDRIGRHTNISAHFEMLMSKHETLFKHFDVKEIQPKRNAL